MARTLNDDVGKIVATLAELYDVEGEPRLASILRASDFDLEQTEYDNWNGGTYTYALSLKIAPRDFAELGDTVSPTENQLLERLKLMTRAYSNEYLGSVIITPSLDGSASGTRVGTPAAEPAFWMGGHFKLFMSHISAQKRFATEVEQRHAI